MVWMLDGPSSKARKAKKQEKHDAGKRARVSPQKGPVAAHSEQRWLLEPLKRAKYGGCRRHLCLKKA